MESYEFQGIVELFPQDKGWHFVRVPDALSEPFKRLEDRGLIAVTAFVGSSAWNTSQLPMGDGSHFIALPATVRSKEKIHLGDTVKVMFRIRERR
ncbi:hypothetical protein FACS1894211_05960 [Clostridia bacterium]|nr:hypothetical protein FACS1894211_05960 [Clostridia bacterium]